MADIREVNVNDVLCARDARAACQRRLIAAHRLPLVSFTMNIAGPIKLDDLIRRAFAVGVQRIEDALRARGVRIAERVQNIAFTGCELILAVNAPVQPLKQWMCALEEQDELGRLFDMDVLDAQGNKLGRTGVRKCLICGGDVHACARSRAHSARELYQRAREIMQGYFDSERAAFIGMCAEKALLFEAITTPKPGLVDCEDSGAHNDMDLFSFIISASALRDWFVQSARIGMDMRNAPDADIFAALRARGYRAEESMFKATHGVNTHKGALFSLGILCCAAGRAGEEACLEDILNAAARIAGPVLGDFEGLKADETRTGGENQYLQSGRTGIRGEAAAGFPNVRKYGYPVLKAALEEGRGFNMSGLTALVSLMAHLEDSNILRRRGETALSRVQQLARTMEGGRIAIEELRRINMEFIRESISPGGSADLLALSYFLYFILDSNGGKQP